MLDPMSYLFNKICEHSMDKFSDDEITEEVSEQIMDEAQLCDLNDLIKLCEKLEIFVPEGILENGIS